MANKKCNHKLDIDAKDIFIPRRVSRQIPCSDARETLQLVEGETTGLSTLKLVVKDEFNTNMPGVFSALAGAARRMRTRLR